MHTHITVLNLRNNLIGKNPQAPGANYLTQNYSLGLVSWHTGINYAPTTKSVENFGLTDPVALCDGGRPLPVDALAAFGEIKSASRPQQSINPGIPRESRGSCECSWRHPLKRGVAVEAVGFVKSLENKMIEIGCN
jgi:hypothetical protein